MSHLKILSYGHASCWRLPDRCSGISGWAQGRRYLFRRVIGRDKQPKILVWDNSLDRETPLTTEAPPWSESDEFTEAEFNRFFAVAIEIKEHDGWVSKRR